MPTCSQLKVFSIGITLVNVDLVWLNRFSFLFLVTGRSTRYSNRLNDFSVTIPSCSKNVYVNSFFPVTARLWNSLLAQCFPLNFQLNGFKCRIDTFSIWLFLNSFPISFSYFSSFSCNSVVAVQHCME